MKNSKSGKNEKWHFKKMWLNKGMILKMKQIKRNKIKILLYTLLIFTILTLASSVQAAGVDGTTIVLNPRTWCNLDRLCKWF